MTTTRRGIVLGTTLFALCLLLWGCDGTGGESLLSADGSTLNAEAQKQGGQMGEGPFDGFSSVAYDIEAAPDGSILVTENNTVREIRGGEVRDVVEIPTIPGSPINGLEVIGRRSFFATSGGLDLAAGAGVWHVSNGQARLVGDIETFEIENDPDAFEGPQWKDPLCEEDPSQGFSAGPQSNPYHLKAVSGSTVLVADAAGNTLLSASQNRSVDWVAIFTPPVDENGEYRFLKTALDHPDIDCYVQPVPTAVDVGPDGATYVGELTGSPAVPGWSRVWRIEPGAHHVTCPSDDCTVAIDGLTSVIDLEFGPDGQLYLVEYDKNGWLTAILPPQFGGDPAGGTVKRCDVSMGSCEVLEGGPGDVVLYPAAITFDKQGTLWLLESNLITPTVRQVDVDAS